MSWPDEPEEGGVRSVHTHQPQVSAAHLAAIVASSEDAILSKGLDGIIQSCNAAAERLFGYTAAELVGRNVRLLIPPDRPSEEDEIVARLRRGERVEHFETVRITKSGRLIDVSLTISPLRDDAGRIVGASKIARDITEQKRARAAQAYLAAIVESSEDSILAMSPDGIIQSCNAKAEKLFGYSASELVGQSVRILLPPERQADEEEILSRIRNGERLSHYETVRVAKDGRRLDVSLSVSPIRDPSGRIIGAAKIARDITEQKRVAAELAAQQAWFRITLESIADAVIACDPGGRVTYMNQAAQTLTGWAIEEARGRPLTEVFYILNEKTREPVTNPADLVMRSGHVVGLANHTILVSRQGAEYPIADSAAPIRDDRGWVLGVVLVFRDVTDERKAEEEIAQQREWLETTLESIGDAVIATDVQGRVSFMNPIAEHLTGWRLDDARGRACREVFNIINEESRCEVENPVTRVLAEGVVVGLANHTLLIAADGVERPIDDSGAPIRDRDGRVIGVVLVFRDVSHRRRAEQERRTAAVERDRLLEAERTARAEAERASRVKDEFVAMISHELRTPLNAILGWTQLMMKGRSDPVVLERGLDVVARNTRVQAQLISDLLDVSRITSGKLRLEVESVHPATIVGDAIDTVQQESADKGIAIVRDFDPSVGTIAGDPGRLQQVVWNLLSNAIKFTPQGGRITVRLRPSGSDVEIAVSDTGMGIRREFLPHIFDRFQQADRSITRRFGGLGLGLSIVKHVVHLHGGKVRAESRGEGHGATFTIVLPSSRVWRSTDARIDGNATASVDPQGEASLDGIRVLVVEDEPDTRDFLERFLKTYGADVVTAPSALDALAALSARHPDILVSDIGLPEVDGYDLMRRIRALGVEAGGAIPAIALTAYVRREDRARALRAGYQAHVGKPVEGTELVAAIANLAESINGRRKR